MANKTTITNATINPETNTACVTYSTGTERMYPADKLPKTVTAWIEEHKVDEVEQIDDVVQTVQKVEVIETEATEETAETEQATEQFEQLPATRRPEVRIKKPTLIDEMARKAAKAEVKAMKEVIKEPEQATTQAAEQAATQAAMQADTQAAEQAEAEAPHQTHEEPRTAVNWKEVIKTTGRVIKRETGRLCEAWKKLAAAVAPKAKLAGAATAMLLMDLLAILIPIICDVAIAIAGCAWGFATDILPEWTKYTAAPAAVKAYKAVAKESAKVYKAVVTKAVKDYHDAVSDLTRAYRAVVTAAAIMAYMMRIVLA